VSSILSYNTFNLLNKKSTCRAISPEMGTRAAHLTAQLADLLGLCQQVHGPEVGGGGGGAVGVSTRPWVTHKICLLNNTAPRTVYCKDRDPACTWSRSCCKLLHAMGT